MASKYTTILYKVRKDLDISVVEYCIVDTVQKLAANPSSVTPGWCYKSKRVFADDLGVSKRTINNMINRLIEKDLLIRNIDGLLKSTQKWYDATIAAPDDEDEENTPMQNLHTPHADVAYPPMQELHTPHAKIAHNNTVYRKEDKKEESKEENPPQISESEKQAEIRQMINRSNEKAEEQIKRKEECRLIIEKTETTNRLNTQKNTPPPPNCAPSPSPKFFELYCGVDKEPKSAIENQIMRLISNQQFNANDWPEIEKHIAGYFERTAKVGDEITKKPYRKRAINYLKSQEWIMNPNPIKDATILPSRKKESKVLPPRKQRFG